MSEGWAPEGRRIGKYIVKRELGRGGMGAVYLAEQPGLGREVAIKELILSSDADPTALQRFLQEAQLMARSSHPNLVQVYDMEQVGTSNYIILEYISGHSLRDLINRGIMPLPQSFAVMHGLLQALGYAHRRGIVHRDVKPENVLISREGEVKVTDFGIARLTDQVEGSNATKTGTTVGTPQYMSPEQVSTSKVDGRSDLYSAGIILYEMVCGRPPFTAAAGDGPFTLMAKHVQAPPPPPSMLRPGLDPALEQAVLRSLAKRPEDRFQDGHEFDLALAAIADRLCPGWAASLEPGADLTRMVPGAAPVAPSPFGPSGVFAPGTQPPAPASAMSGGAIDIRGTIETAAYAPTPPKLRGVGGRQVAAPRPERAAGGGLPLPLIAGGVVALLVVVGALAYFLTRPSGQPVAATTPSPVATSSTGGCDFMQPGATFGPGVGSTQCLVLGSSLLDVLFTGATSMPSTLTVFAGTPGQPSGDTAPYAGVGGGSASLRAPSRGFLTAIRSTAAVTDAVALLDFTPTSGNMYVGVGLRCSAAGHCLTASTLPLPQRQSYDISCRCPDTVAIQSGLAPQLRIGQPNRLVVLLRGSVLRVWLNGEFVTQAGNVPATGAGSVEFYLLSDDTNTVSASFQRVSIYQPQS